MIFSIRDLSFELGSMLLEGWPAFAARAVCALLILLAAWLVRRWLTHKGFPALEARSWHFTGTPILLRSFAVPIQRMCTAVGVYLAAASLPWAIPGIAKLLLVCFRLVMTLLVLAFGEITPKSVAKDTPERFAMFSAPFIRLWIWVLTPLNFLFSQWKKLVSRFFKTNDDAKMSHEELLLFMEDVEQDGGIDENEGELLRNALEFRDLTAAEILTHRIELEAVDIDESHEEIARAFTQSRFSRLLVYRDTIDQIVGVLHQKDFYINGKMTDQPITAIMTEPLFVYQHTKIRDILKMLQHQKSHVAVVVDDFGGTLGIVTMEDILEELVGEIWDEHDEVEEDFEKLDENTYRVDCSVSLEDFMEFFDVKLESDSVSVGGWVMEQLNRVPVKGDSFAVQNLEITVSGLSAHRVSSVTVRQCGVCLACAQ